ncbi:MAG: ABC transporter permease [Gemmatimonadota bacterium]
MIQRVRRAIRRLRRAPGYALVSIATLALGIGAITAVYSVGDAVLLRPLPYGDADRLVRLWSAYPEREIDRGTVSPMDLEDWRREGRLFEDMGGFSVFPIGGLILAGGAAPVELETAHVTAGFFRTLAVPALRGRTLQAEDHAEGRNRRIVLSHGAWQRHFGGVPALIGRTVTLSDEAFTVVGVMPPGFEYPEGGIDVWVPTSVIPTEGIPRERFVRWLGVVGRLAEGASVDSAAAEMETIAGRLAAAYPEANEGLTDVTVQALKEVLVGPIRPALLAVFGGVALLLLIACANVANVSLARAEERSRDQAVRAALGASRRRIAEGFLLEALLLGLAGGIVGMVLAIVGVEALIGIAPADLPRLSAVGVNAGVLAFAFGTSLAAGLLSGIASAWRSGRLDLVSGMKDGRRPHGGGRRRRNARDLMLVGQVALVALLAIGGSLLLRSYEWLLDVDPGFEPEGVLTLSVDAGGDDYREFLYEALDRIRAIPGVESAGMVRPLPLGPNTFKGETFGFTISGRDLPAVGDELEASLRIVSPGYFRTMGIPLRSGRDFTERDDRPAPDAPSGLGVVIVSRTMADRYWPGEDPVGSRIQIGDAKAQIVGVVADVRQTALAEEPEPALYAPHRQVSRRGMTIVVKGGDPAALAGPVQRTIWDLRSDQPIADVQSLEAVVSGSLARPRFATTLLATFAALALLLEGVGVYGFIATSVARRHREIGIRRALGAREGDVFQAVLARGVQLAATGVLLGVLIAGGATRIVESLLYGIGRFDPWSIAGASIVLLSVAAGAAAIPALRACRVDPVTAIREE